MPSGHCLCGAVRYEYSGAPELVVHCHCESCRRQTGAPVATFVIVPKASLTFSGDAPREYQSSAGVWRAFCPSCGSALYYRGTKRPEVIDLYAGSLDDPAALVPECHVHAAEQLPWFEMLDHLPRYAGSRWGDGPIRHGPRE